MGVTADGIQLVLLGFVTLMLIVRELPALMERFGFRRNHRKASDNPGPRHASDACAQLLGQFAADGVIGKIHGNTSVTKEDTADTVKAVTTILHRVEDLGDFRDLLQRQNLILDQTGQTLQLILTDMGANRRTIGHLDRSLREFMASLPPTG